MPIQRVKRHPVKISGSAHGSGFCVLGFGIDTLRRWMILLKLSYSIDLDSFGRISVMTGAIGPKNRNKEILCDYAMRFSCGPGIANGSLWGER